MHGPALGRTRGVGAAGTEPSTLALRVVGISDARCLGHLDWFVRIRSTLEVIDSEFNGALAPTPEDRRLLRLLAEDARTSIATLAHLTATPESTVRRRLNEFVESGLLLFEIEIDPRSTVARSRRSAGWTSNRPGWPT
ncbi:IclR helix-turn-helix domain protein [Streptomyces sp. ADI92-24]|uniref:Lrp/AsnC family transcriptional regulator n=1 Tax=unclassified Streptomyces TaxID=2593676 RepID=UPI000FACDCDE|nr:Lrp/AsnC family transcriptional regulator [Streptomyces sp. ADI92-24]RPK40702.1 IclR helix-turn-helix domain protein [Streptomyces sp. ADI92-24]